MRTPKEEHATYESLAREARVREMAEKLFVAAAPTLFNQVPTDEAGAELAFQVAEAFERVAEAHK